MKVSFKDSLFGFKHRPNGLVFFLVDLENRKTTVEHIQHLNSDNETSFSFFTKTKKMKKNSKAAAFCVNKKTS